MKKKSKIIIVFLICMGLMVSATAIAVQYDLVSLDKFESIFTKVNENSENGIEDNNEDIEEPVITPNNSPDAKYTFVNDLYVVTFIDQSNDVDNDKLSYLWDFGDGISSIKQNPVHTYDCSETNSFDCTLTVSDGEFTDTYKQGILFGSHLNILDYSHVWTWDDVFYKEKYGDYLPIWFGDISMAVENTGNMPAEISYAKINTQEKENGYPIFSGTIRFSFSYTYYEIIEDVEGGEGNGLGSELGIEFISDNTLTISPGETLTLNSNPELTYLSWDAGTYPVNIWLYEKRNARDISHTLYETYIELT